VVRFGVLERRRLRGARLLHSGVHPAESRAKWLCVTPIGALIQKHFDVKLAQSSVWRTLRHMGWSVQRPARHARERDEQAVRVCKRKRGR
jgi:transposase